MMLLDPSSRQGPPAGLMQIHGGLPALPGGCGFGGANGLSLSVEKLLDGAQLSGDLRLMGRNLKAFPDHGRKYNLGDTISTDMSRNKLTELPQECTDFTSMERLVLYHNTIRSIPDTVVCLQSLQFLDLSRNQLSYLPASICQLPCLQGLILNNNRLVSLPEEIGRMQSLMELDASCNEITHLPVQIGDLGALRALNLRRNHLQEVPVELSYLQLTSLDLSANRITVLPVEIRFMTTVVQLNLGENPLSCPPANLCSRGRVHVFKYLEIQAIKEDRKRGVLTDVEYRRSYRKTGGGQLNDFRFANGFNADARQKRHTADSGYGSEQPLDRRWSQEFSQEVMDMHTEDARRIVLRAANCSNAPRSPRGGGLMNAANSHMSINNHVGRPQPLTSTGSNSSASSGYSSMLGPVVPPPSSLRVATPSVSSGSSGSLSNNVEMSPVRTARLNGLEHEFQKMMDGMFSSAQEKTRPRTSNSDCQLNAGTAGDTVDLGAPPAPRVAAGQPGLIPGVGQQQSPRGESPDDQEKEERRRAAHMVLGKQGQFKEHLRQQRQSESTYQQHQQQQIQRHTNMIAQQQRFQSTGGSSESSSTEAHYDSSSSSLLSSSKSSTERMTKVSAHGTKMSTTTRTTLHMQQQQYDVKTMQKEAVLSYVKSKQYAANSSSSSSLSTGGLAELPSSNPRHHASGSNSNSGGLVNSSRSSSTSSIPQPTSNGHGSQRNFAARRDAEKSASADAHINQLRMHIESRLRITLNDDLAASLQDGVVLCHIANHVKPRAVPSIHVPSPAVPKLHVSKCRRNVENFLLACRKIGVREEDLFAWDSFFPDFEARPVLSTLTSLLDLEGRLDLEEEDSAQHLSSSSPEPNDDEPNYPDLVPREEPRHYYSLATKVAACKGDAAVLLPRGVESAMLLALFLGTILLLYLFPAEPYFT